jgi:predicted enzyme related to lactoylglutathione lyase
VVGKAGAPVWHQLKTSDYHSAIAFYREVFGWHTKQVVDNDEFRYITAWFDDQELQGIADGAKTMPDDTPGSVEHFLRNRRPRHEDADDHRQRRHRAPASSGQPVRATRDRHRSNGRDVPPVLSAPLRTQGPTVSVFFSKFPDLSRELWTFDDGVPEPAEGESAR